LTPHTGSFTGWRRRLTGRSTPAWGLPPGPGLPLANSHSVFQSMPFLPDERCPGRISAVLHPPTHGRERFRAAVQLMLSAFDSRRCGDRVRRPPFASGDRRSRGSPRLSAFYPPPVDPRGSRLVNLPPVRMRQASRGARGDGPRPRTQARSGGGEIWRKVSGLIRRG
jgi:hypothetical protein